MKQILLLALTVCLLSNICQATTISGTVTNTATGLHVNNQNVWATDDPSGIGNWPYYSASAFTDTAGHYTIQLPLSVGTGTTVYVNTVVGLSTQTQSLYYTGINVNNVDFNVSCSTSYYRIQGYVDLGYPIQGAADVYVIRVGVDSVTNDTTLTAIDTIITNSAGEYSRTYAYDITAGGSILMKAAMRPGPLYANYLPTYYISSLNWQNATYITNSSFSDTFNICVRTLGAYPRILTMIPGVNPGGPGFIGGSVILGANKGTNVGDPLNNRLLLLTTSTGQGVAYTYSGASGEFAFPSLPYGTYKLFGDAWGKRNPPLTITLSAANPTIRDVVFKENNKKFEGYINSLSIANPVALEKVSVSPNPSANKFRLAGLNAVHGTKTAVLTGIDGAIAAQQSIAAGDEAWFSTSSLASGIYMLNLKTEEGNAHFRVVVTH